MRRPGRRKKIPVLPYLLILPAMLLFIVFNYYPFFKAVFLSFTLTDKTGHFAKWVGLSNWVRILGKSSFWQVIWITVKMAAINLVFTYLIAGNEEDPVFQNLSDDVRIAYGNRFISGGSNFPVYLPAEKRTPE